MATSIDAFVVQQLKLLDLESAAEIAENRCLQEGTCVKDLQKRGVCLKNLKLTKSYTGAGGRALKTFEHVPNKHLPSHTIGTGDIIGVGLITSENSRDIIAEGVVLKIGESSITVDFGKSYNSPALQKDVQYLLIRLGNDVTYRRMIRALRKLRRTRNGPTLNLINVLFGHSVPSCVDSSIYSNLTFVNNNLNAAQKEAVSFALSQKEIAVIHGPPGTGKTTTVVEIILQAASQGLKVLACAPSNVAVDNLIEKLAPYKTRMVRLGHPARFLPSIYKYSLDAIVSSSDGGQVIDDLRRELETVNVMINQTNPSVAKMALQYKKREMVAELKDREITVIRDTLTNYNVVLTTLISAHDMGPIRDLPDDHFDLALIDECSQALEAACWIPLMHAPKCILAGDHRQLPPIIKSDKAAKEGLEETLMERIIKIHGELIVKMLHTQYRMHQDLMEWPSTQLYENKLIADSTVACHLLKELPEVEDSEDTNIPLLMIDTTGCHLDELVTSEDESKGNEGEADVVAAHVRSLISCGVNPVDIAVVTPYNRQVDLIKLRILEEYPTLEIKSIDGFQGREKEAVVLSLVRANCKGEVGFLCEDRRINVAITRARRHLALICNSETVSHHPFLKSLIGFIQQRGEIRSASQYENDIGLYPPGSDVSSQRPTVTKKKEKKKDCKKLKITENVATNDVQIKEPRDATLERFRSIIQVFMDSSNNVYSFSPDLSAFERRIVHEVAEEYGIIHESQGEGNDRFIEIKKKMETDENLMQEFRPIARASIEDLPETVVEDTNPIRDMLSTAKAKAKESTERKCPHCSKIIPTSNIDLHVIHCKKEASAKAKKSKPKIKPSPLSNPRLQEDDFDALIAAVVKADKTCSFVGCKTCIATLRQTCEFCKNNFCFSHFIPEAHGCGAEAKAYARSQIRKDGKLYPGSGRPEKKQDPAKQAQIQRKFDKKLGELSKQRKSKSTK